jgi:hypothetical protein
MRKLFIIFYSCMIYNCVAAQQKPSVFLNHVYFVLDSNTFNNLFDDSYLQTIADTTEKRTTTSNSSWSGKYIFGKNSYLEFFEANGFEGATLGSSGFGFMTHKSGDFNTIKNNWQKIYTDSLQTDTTVVTSRGPAHKWFYATGLPIDTTIATSTWLMENTPDELKSVGFTDNEIKQPISWQQYYEKRYQKKFLKPLNKITKVEIITNKKEYDYLKISLLGFGLKEANNSFYNDEVKIQYTIANVPSTELKTVTFALDDALLANTVTISNHLILQVNDKTAMFTFNY